MSVTLSGLEAPSEQEPAGAEIVRIARALAHAVNNRLVLPLGLLELLEQRAEVPADLRPLFGPARQALQEMAIEAVQLEVQTRPRR